MQKRSSNAKKKKINANSAHDDKIKFPQAPITTFSLGISQFLDELQMATVRCTVALF